MDGACSALKKSLAAIAIISSMVFAESTLADEEKQVKWAQLTQHQRTVLKPLEKEWDSLRPWQSEKMLQIAQDFQGMSADQQARVQLRLTKWSRMTPYERDQARKYHQQFKTMSDENQEAFIKQWELYESLTEAQKEELRKSTLKPKSKKD